MEHISTLVPQQVSSPTLSKALPGIVIGWAGANLIVDGGRACIVI